jgi:hypothetical protein
MDYFLKRAGLALAAATLVALTACGGGGDPAPAATTPPPPAATAAAVTLSGTAASGAAFTGAVVTVFDSRGTLVGTSAPTDAGGSYTVTLLADAAAPFIVIASRATADGERISMVSIAESASVTTLNITPVTHLIASRLSASGDPLKLASEVAAGTVRPTPAAIAAVIADVKKILAPMLTATGTTDANPLTTPFAANGTGYDRLLDSLSIRIVPASASSANIEVTIKTTTAGDSTTPPTIQFTNSQPVGSVTTSNLVTANSVEGLSISSANLLESGTSVLISDLLQELTVCHALPLASRVSGVSGTVTSSTAVTGTASAVIAPECKAVFHNGDPATYRSNGLTVGRDANNVGAFTSLFRNAATGTVFSEGSFQAMRNNGDTVIGYKSRDSAGTEAFDAVVVRRENGKLRLMGNLYAYPGAVAALHQSRQFITLGQSGYNYLSSGYTLAIDNLQNGANPAFHHVEVTTPGGVTMTLWPTAGAPYLVFKSGASFTSTNYYRMSSAYVSPDLTASPSTLEGTALVFASPQRSDDEMAAASGQSPWTFKYFIFGNTTSTPNATQYYKTRARALSIAELKQKDLAMLVPAYTASLSAAANTTTGMVGLGVGSTLDISFNGGDAWSVTAAALPPTGVRAFGRSAGNVAFEDAASVTSATRKTVVPCTTTSVSDVHCTGPSSTTYAGGSLSGLQLLAREVSGREYSSFYAMYKLPLP